MKRGEDGAAVKAHRPWGRYELWDPQEDGAKTKGKASDEQKGYA